MVSDHVGKESAHVRQHTRMIDQFGKEVMFEARGRRLDPEKLPRIREQIRGQLPEKSVRIADGLAGLRDVVAIDDLEHVGAFSQTSQSLIVDCGRDDQFASP